MASSLYNSSRNARKVFVALLILALIYIGLDTYGKFNQSLKIIAPAHFSFYKDPDYAVGSMKDLGFPKIISIPTKTSVIPRYSLSSVFSSFPDTAYAYKVDKPRELLTTSDDAQNTARVLGFSDSSTQQGDSFTWNSAKNTKFLKFNKANAVWNMRTLYSDNIEAKKNKTLFTDITQYDSLISGAISSLGFGNSYNLSTGNIASSFADLQSDGTLFKPESNRTANYLVANVFRTLDFTEFDPTSIAALKDKTLLPAVPTKVNVYKSDARRGAMRFVVSNSFSDYTKDIFEFDFTNLVYSFNNGIIQKGIYPIITPDEGWNLVQTGKGALTLITPEDGNQLISYPNLGITQIVDDGAKTEFGYFEPEEWTGYIYPIYIYSGRAQLDNGKQASFKIYVDALKRF